MDKSLTPLPLRLLCSAESFGFGPAAAIADFFPYLREGFESLAFAGRGHVLDLHRSLDYDTCFDLDQGLDDDYLSWCDLFLSACDFTLAEQAIARGIPTIIYDPLTWYWPEIPDVVRRANLYLAQAFHGVAERLKNERESFGKVEVVSPLAPRHCHGQTKTLFLLNMGGLQNPFWDDDTCIKYARLMVRAFREAVDAHDSSLIVCSAKIAAALADEGVTTLNRGKILDLLPQVRCAVQTSGLANIFDSAAFGIPSLFLPPANDSQGQQLDLLRRHREVDAFIDWGDLFPDEPIRYRDEQWRVLQKIAVNIDKLGQPHEFLRFTAFFRDAFNKIKYQQGSAAEGLIRRFGCNGAHEVATAVESFARTLCHQEVCLV